MKTEPIAAAVSPPPRIPVALLGLDVGRDQEKVELGRTQQLLGHTAEQALAEPDPAPRSEDQEVGADLPRGFEEQIGHGAIAGEYEPAGTRKTRLGEEAGEGGRSLAPLLPAKGLGLAGAHRRAQQERRGGRRINVGRHQRGGSIEAEPQHDSSRRHRPRREVGRQEQPAIG